MQSGEDASPGLALEVHAAADRPVVLPARLVQVDSGHFARCKVNVTNVSNSTWLRSVHPHSHSDHQARCVLIQDDVRSRGPAQSGLGKSSLLQLRTVALRRCLPVSGLRSVDRTVGASSIISKSKTFRGLSAENRDVRCAATVDWSGSRWWRFRVVAAVASIVVVVAGR